MHLKGTVPPGRVSALEAYFALCAQLPMRLMFSLTEITSPQPSNSYNNKGIPPISEGPISKAPSHMSFYVLLTATQGRRFHNPNFTHGETEAQGGCLPGSGTMTIEKSRLFLPTHMATCNPTSIVSFPGEKNMPISVSPLPFALLLGW